MNRLKGAKYLLSLYPSNHIDKVLFFKNTNKENAHIPLVESLITLDEHRTEQLKQIAEREDVTERAVLLTIWGILLQRYQLSSDVTLGIHTGRSNPNQNPIVMPFLIASPSSYVKEAFYQINQLLKEYEACVEEESAASCVKDLESVDHYVVLEEDVRIDVSAPLICSMYSHNDRLTMRFAYDTERVDSEFVNDIAEHLIEVIKSIHSNQMVMIEEINLVTEQEKRQLLEDFNRTEEEYSKHLTLQVQFEQKAAEHPDRAAIVFEDDQLTYRELNERANQFAHVLCEKGVEKGKFVAIMVDRSIEMVVSVLAVLKAGAAYLPIDPAYPADRIQYMLEDSEAVYLITHRQLKAPEGYAGQIIRADEASIFQGDVSNLELLTTADDLAYMIYTSGSTGKPKGVMLAHRGVSNFCLVAETYGIVPESHVLQFSSFSFDSSVGEIFPVLLTGATLYMARKELLLSGSEFVAWLREHKIASVVFPPSMLRALPYAELPDLTTVITAGEACSLGLVEKWGEGRTFLNAYGPTEATVGSTIGVCTLESKRITIGKPNPNKKVYIVNEANQLQPIGVPGELCIGGDGLAQGYWKRPDLTEERFVANPFLPGEKMYRTGDLARWLPDGNIDYLGRIDDQVKIRGHRIEPNEVAEQLLSHEAVAEIAVIAMTDEEGRADLCAYLVANREWSIQELRQHIMSQLPEYMVPSYFIEVQEIPLTPNGKIDKKALPKPDGEVWTGAEYAAPENEIQHMLAEIWQDVLKVKPVGIHDNFILSGGHSLKLAMLRSRIFMKFHVELSFEELLQNPILKQQAEYIQHLDKQEYTQLQELEARAFYPVSSAQRRMYAVQQMPGIGHAYHLPSLIEIEGELDKGKLGQALQQLVDRHESLRTSFHFMDGELVQRIEHKASIHISYYEASGAHEAIELAGTLVKPFDLSRAPLIHAAIIRMSPDHHFLFMDMHHIISDGVSTQLLYHELVELYQGQELPALLIQYKEYANWQLELRETTRWSDQEKFWVEQLSGELPVVELPMDYPRPAKQQFCGNRKSFTVGSDMLGSIQQAAEEQQVTLYTLLLAAYHVLLSKYSGQEDIIVGTPIAGRTHIDLEQVVGMFVNTLAIRSFPRSEQTFGEFLAHMKERLFSAYEHGDYSLDELIGRLEIQRNAGWNALFDTMFVLQNMEHTALNFSGTVCRFHDMDWNHSMFDMTWSVIEKDTLQFTIEYNTSLFMQETIERMFGHYHYILKQVAANPSLKLSDIELVTEQEKQQLLEDFNRTEADYSRHLTLQAQFEQKAAEHPDRVAVVFEDDQLTYRELNERANQFARVLQDKGAQKGQFVAIMVDRSIEMIVSVLAVLKAGAAYLPIDPAYPADRIQYMLEDSEASYLITHRQLEAPECYAGQCIRVDDASIFQGDASNLEQLNTADDLAYMIYTSGSTGKPKGVMLPHRGVSNFCLVAETYGILPESHVLQFSSFSFDSSVGEIFPVLLTGATLYMARKELLLSGVEFVSWLREHKIASVVFPPSVLRALPYAELPDLTTVITAGEACSIDLVEKWGEGRTFLNAYGPTEATIGSTIGVCTPELKRITIGKPISNKKIYIVNEANQLQPIGVPGELCIGGDGLAQGYWKRPDLTEEKFVANPFLPGEKMYRTGDLARWLPDGNIDYLGRIDDQVKIRGHRIEPNEVAEQLLSHEAVAEIAVIAMTDEEGRADLCAYLVANREWSIQELRQHIMSQLPEYMVPTYFIEVKEIPLTPNGKIDKKMLPKPDGDVWTGAEYAAPENEMQQLLAEIWQDVLKVNQVGIHDHFIEMGGDSIKAIQVSARLYDRRMKLDASDLFRFPTIYQLAPFVTPCGVTISQDSAQGEVLLTPIQKWFLERNMHEPHYWNQAMMVHRPEGWEPDAVHQVFETLVRHHDALRMVFPKKQQGTRTQMNKPAEGEHFTVQVLDLKSFSNLSSIVEEEANKLQQSLNLDTGPLVRAAIFQTRQGDYLFIVVHHLVIDGVSWRILIEDLDTAYRQVLRGDKPVLPDKTHSYQAWSQQLQQYASSKSLLNQIPYWTAIEKANVPALPQDLAGNAPYYLKDYAQFEIKLSKEHTVELLTEAHRAYHTEVNHLLLTALVLTVQEWTRESRVLIELEGHGRENMMDDGLNISRTIGWFTSIYPVLFEFHTSDDLALAIKSVKETMRGIPDKGIGYSILKYLTPAEYKPADMFRQQPQISFNYLGTFDQEGAQGFGSSELPVGDSFSPLSPASHDLVINAVVIRNELQISMEYNMRTYRTDTVRQLAERYRTHLLAVISHCIGKQDVELTPSDYSANKLSIEELDDIFLELQKL
ncbi:amino acid adenylation domain-containing protein [Paenibacillus solani]|uniref:amino acid adenylation domain-containing protein n=1 Tax=Paenibacillus solani TaxID=1705565 RepID=UPI003D29F2CD